MLLIQAILLKLSLKPYALYDLKFFSIIRLYFEITLNTRDQFSPTFSAGY
jgi:hypothetical protein